MSEKTARLREQKAYLKGQRDAMAAQVQAEAITNTPSVWIVGKVANPTLPWSEDLTLTRAIIAAQYQGLGDPKLIIVRRDGGPSQRFTAADLLHGADLNLLPGDKIEIRQ